MIKSFYNLNKTIQYIIPPPPTPRVFFSPAWVIVVPMKVSDASVSGLCILSNVDYSQLSIALW